MTPLDVLSTIRKAGGTVVVEDGDLVVRVKPGILGQEHKASLAQHKASLVSLLPDGEREAIQWLESLSADEAEVVVQAALKEWSSIVASKAHHKAVDDDPDPWELAIEPPDACEQCGSLVLWRDFGGRWHCRKCEPPIRSEFLQAKAQRLRQQGTLTGPPGQPLRLGTPVRAGARFDFFSCREG